MPNFERNNGFTLIELIVVIALVSIMLFLAIPRFQNSFLSNSTKEVSRWILLKVPVLKEKAAIEQKKYSLHFDFDSQRLWITHEGMSQEVLQDARMNGYKLPEKIKLLDVELPGEEKISTGRADIYFYAKGYSDKAMIHIENGDGEQWSFLIKPFLPRVQLYNQYVGFEY